VDKKGPVYVLICYVLWGLLPIFWKMLAAVDSFYILGIRIVWSLVLILPVLLLQRRWNSVCEVMRDRKELLLLVLAGIAICINWGTYIWAVNRDHVLDASLAYYMNPILSILLGTVVFRERLTRLQWMAVGVTAIGIILAVIRSGQIPWIALIIGGSFAIYGALKKGVHSDAGVSLFFETAVLAPLALAFIVVAEVQGNGAIGALHGAQWLLLPAAGVVTTVPLLAFAKGIRVTPMTLTGILMYINPTLQMLVSVVLYHEAFTDMHVILFGFVWSGLALYLLSGYYEARKRAKEEHSCV